MAFPLLGEGGTSRVEGPRLSKQLFDNCSAPLAHLWESPEPPGVTFASAWRATFRNIRVTFLLSAMLGFSKDAVITTLKTLTRITLVYASRLVRSIPAHS